MSGDGPARLFVYGSLQPGGSNAHILDDVHGEWHTASVRGRLVDQGWAASLGYWALVLDESADAVNGHVLQAGALADRWPALDEFEGENYRRITAMVTLADGREVDAQMYVANDGEGET